MPATAAEAIETVTVDKTAVPCDGGGGALGHPKVYLKIDPATGEVTCPYCSRHYVLDPDAKTDGGH